MARRQPYSEEASIIVRNVHSLCTAEKKHGLEISLDRSLDRTAALTGVSKATVKRMLARETAAAAAEPKKVAIARVERVKLDGFDKGVVRRTINTMYAHKKLLPTLNNIRASLQEDIGYTGSKQHLREELLKLGFTYKRCQSNRKILMERKDVVLHRIQ